MIKDNNECEEERKFISFCHFYLKFLFKISFSKKNKNKKCLINKFKTIYCYRKMF